MKCKKCNAHIEVGSTICPGCGTSVLELQNTGNLENDGAMQQQPQMNSVGNLVVGATPNVVPAGNPTQPNQVNVVTENSVGMPQETVPTGTIAQNQINPVNINGEDQGLSENSQIGGLPNEQPIPLNHEGNLNLDGSQSMNSQNQKQGLKIDLKQQKGILICAGLILIIAVISFGLLKFLKAGPKDIFDKSLDRVFHLATDQMENYDKSLVSSISIKPKVELDDANYNQIAKMINKLNLGFHYGMDRNKKVMNFELQSSYDNGPLFNANAYFGNKKALLYLPGIYNKYIDTEMEEQEYETLFEVENQDEIETILSEIKSALKKSLKKEYFETDYEKIVIDGSEVKVKKSILSLDAKKMNEIQKEFLNELSNQDDFIKAVAKIGNEKEADIKEELQALAKEENDLSDMNNTFTLSIYTKGLLNDFVGVKIEAKEDYNDITLKMIKQDKDEYTYELQSAGSTLVSGSVLTKQDGDKKDTTFVLKVPNFGKIELQMTTNTEYGKKVEALEIPSSNIIGSSQMTQQDITNIQNALLQNEGLKKLMQQIQPLLQYSSNLNYGYDDNGYDYDDYSYNY